MSADNQSHNDPLAYIENLRKSTRTSLNLNRGLMIFLAIFVALYMGCITSKLNKVLEPPEVTEYIVGYAENMINENLEVYIRKAKEEIPKLVQKRIPDWATSQIPEYRIKAQDLVVHYLDKSIGLLEPKVSKSLQEYVTKNKQGINQYNDLLAKLNKLSLPAEKAKAKADIEKLVKQLGDEFSSGLMEIAEKREFGDADVIKEYERSHKRLEQLNNELSKLNQEESKLAIQDRNLRYAIAIMLDSLGWTTAAHPKKKDDPQKPKGQPTKGPAKGTTQ